VSPLSKEDRSGTRRGKNKGVVPRYGKKERKSTGTGRPKKVSVKRENIMVVRSGRSEGPVLKKKEGVAKRQGPNREKVMWENHGRST